MIFILHNSIIYVPYLEFQVQPNLCFFIYLKGSFFFAALLIANLLAILLFRKLLWNVRAKFLFHLLLELQKHLSL